MNPLRIFDTTSGILKVFAAFMGMAFMAWVVFNMFVGPAAMRELQEIEARNAAAREAEQAAEHQEMRDIELADEGWGSGMSDSDVALDIEYFEENLATGDFSGGWGSSGD